MIIVNLRIRSHLFLCRFIKLLLWSRGLEVLLRRSAFLLISLHLHFSVSLIADDNLLRNFSAEKRVVLRGWILTNIVRQVLIDLGARY